MTIEKMIDENELYSTLMSHSEFHKEAIDEYVKFIKKYKHASSSFLNDKIREYCRNENIIYSISCGIKCIKLIDEYVRTEIKFGNK